MRYNIIETIMGGVVLVIAAFFLTFAYQTSGYKQADALTYHARFDRIDGLVVGAEVKIGGVKVGTIKSLAVNPETYQADVAFSVDQKIKLPKDSSGEIIGDGLMGGKFLALVPGGDDEFLKSGGHLSHTQSAVSLESLIGQLIFSNKKDEPKEDGKHKNSSLQLTEKKA